KGVTNWLMLSTDAKHCAETTGAANERQTPEQDERSADHIEQNFERYIQKTVVNVVVDAPAHAVVAVDHPQEEQCGIEDLPPDPKRTCPAGSNILKSNILYTHEHVHVEQVEDHSNKHDETA